MNPLDGLLYGLSVATMPQNLLAAFVGALLGTAIGVLPGVGPMTGLALLLPLTFAMSPVTGLIALAGIYYGVMYGGSTTSILVNIPGEAASVVTTFDGYQMTKRGRAGAALTVVAIGSFIAGTLSVVGVMLFAPLLSSWALSFGPPQLFALTTVGLIVLSRVSGGTFAGALFVTALGLLLATIGTDPISASSRLTFGLLELSRGIDLTPAAVGLFGVSEMFLLVERLVGIPKAQMVKFRDLFPTRAEWSRSVPAWMRGTVIGFPIGLLPGPAGMISAFSSYRLEKAVSRRKEEFGQGAIEGVAGPEAANNAAATASYVPLLSLGIPFTPILAILMAAMMIQGVQPGPLLMTQHPEIFWGVIASMYIGNVMLLVLNLPLIGIWVSLLRVPLHILVACIVLFTLIGPYSVRNSLFDLWVLLGAGVLGYVFRKLDLELAPLVLALVLGTLIETHLRQSLFLSQGDPSIFISSPISVAIWIVGLLVLAGGPLGHLGLRLVRARAY